MNKVILIGRLGGDVKVIKQNGDENMFCVFDLATSEYNDKTEWHRVVSFSRLAEIIQNLGVGKGDLVCVEGRIHTKRWEDKEGNKRKTKKIIANRFELLARYEINKQDNSTDKPF